MRESAARGVVKLNLEESMWVGATFNSENIVAGATFNIVVDTTPLIFGISSVNHNNLANGLPVIVDNAGVILVPVSFLNDEAIVPLGTTVGSESN